MNDKLMIEVTKGHDSGVRLRAELEFRMLSALIEGCTARGFTLYGVNDGEETERMSDPETAIRACFAVDEAVIYFTRGARKFAAVLVFGNEGWDLVSDYTDDSRGAVDPEPGTFAHAVTESTRELVERYS